MIPAARPDIGEDEVNAALDVIRSGMLAQGAEVEAFEREFALEAVDERLCVAVNSGTSAQHLAMVALGIGPGDEVIVPSFTFAATANCVAFTGATPVFVDIEPDHFTIDPAAVEAAITPRTRGVVPVHLYGHPANLSALTEVCERNGLWLVEDAAQAHLASWAGHLVGTVGVAATFSFYPTKNMTSGEGGMIVTSDPGIARIVRLLRNQGQEKRYENEIVGLNNRMTDVHAAIGRVQLAALKARTQKRRENAKFYDEHLRGVVTPTVHAHATHVYHQYTIRLVDQDRGRFVEQLASLGVATGIYYPTPVHRLASYKRADALHHTDIASREVLSLPVYPSLSEAERDRVAAAVNHLSGAGA